MSVLLSEIIQTAPKFSFFDELITIPTDTSLQAHDFIKINKIIDDIGLYLKELHILFVQIYESKIDSINDVEWYFEGKYEINELVRSIDNVESIISKLLIVIDSAENSNHIHFNHLLNKFEETNDLLFEVKKFLILFKRKVDISINYKELTDITIQSLNKEVEDCLKLFIQLQDYKLIPNNIPKFNLEEVISKMKINKISNNFTMKSINLPTFNDLDNSMYQNYTNLEFKIEPLRVSIDFLPLRIQEFKSICSKGKQPFPNLLEEIDNLYDSLISKWEYLMNEIKVFKVELIDFKWNEIFIYLIEEIVKIINNLLEEFSQNPSKNITKKIGDNYKLCINTMTMIKSAVKENIINNSKIIDLFNNQLIVKWNELNDILTTNKRSEDIFEIHHDSNLRSFQTKKRNVSRVTTSPIKNPNEPAGLGIDLGIEVEDNVIPLSIKHPDKIRDIQKSFQIPKSRNLLNEFKLKDEDEETLVSNMADLSVVKTPERINRNDMNVPISDLRINKGFISKIPKLIKNYIQRNGIKARPLIYDKNTKIPIIDKSHPRFQKHLATLNSMNVDHNPTDVNSQFNSPKQLYSPITFQRPRSLTRTRTRSNSRPISPTPRFNSRHSSKTFLSPVNLGLTPQLGNTPNLSYPQSSPSYNSTSPDRPTSSIGSRFDDEHLLQPLKHIKPAWR